MRSMPMIAGELMLSTTSMLCWTVWLLTLIGSSNLPTTHITLVDALSNLMFDGFLVGWRSTGIFLNSLRAKTVTFSPVSHNQLVVTPYRVWTLIKCLGTEKDFEFALFCFDFRQFSMNKAVCRVISSTLRLLSKVTSLVVWAVTSRCFGATVD